MNYHTGNTSNNVGVLDIPNVRKTDPEPSKIAARAVNRKNRITNAIFLLEIMRRIKHKGFMTNREVYYGYEIHFTKHKMDKYEVAQRMCDLKKLEPKVIESGEMRRCTYARKNLSTYKAV